MRIPAVALVLGCVVLPSADPALGQKPKADPLPALSARIEVDEHEHSFSVRFLLKNNGEKDTDVVYGRGDSGMHVVPKFDVAGVTITPPTYLSPPRRSMKANALRIPAGKEVLYGTFTMGYPPVDQIRERNEDMTAVIHFQELKATLRSEAQRLKIPAKK